MRNPLRDDLRGQLSGLLNYLVPNFLWGAWERVEVEKLKGKCHTFEEKETFVSRFFD